MSSRSSRKQRSVPYDLDNPFNWTTLHLKRKLEAIGIKVSAAIPKHALRQLYIDNAPSAVSRPADRLHERNNSTPAQPGVRQSEDEVSILPHPNPPSRRRRATIVHVDNAHTLDPAEVIAAETVVQSNIPEVGTTFNMAATDMNTLSPANIMTSINSIQRSIVELNNSITDIRARQQAFSPTFPLAE